MTSNVDIRLVVARKGKERLTAKGQEGTFWGNGNDQYLDWDGVT